jgi:hypothetical protein
MNRGGLVRVEIDIIYPITQVNLPAELSQRRRLRRETCDVRVIGAG